MAGEESGVQGPEKKTTQGFNEKKRRPGLLLLGCVSLYLKVI